MGSPSGPLSGNILSGLATKNINMKGRRVIGAGDAQDQQDYITLADLTTTIKQVVANLSDVQLSEIISLIRTFPVVQFVQATLTLVLTNVSVDVPGATITLRDPGVYLVTGNFGMYQSGAGDIGNNLIGILNVGGVDRSDVVVSTAINGNCANTISNQWLVTTSTSSVVVKLRGSKSGGTGASAILGASPFITNITSMRVG